MENDDNETEELKFDNLEEDQASVILKKIKTKKTTHQLPPQKNTISKLENPRENVNKKVNESITSTKKNIDTVDKIEKLKKPPEVFVTSKIRKMTQLKKQINKGLLQ